MLLSVTQISSNWVYFISSDIMQSPLFAALNHEGLTYYSFDINSVLFPLAGIVLYMQQLC